MTMSTDEVAQNVQMVVQAIRAADGGGRAEGKPATRIIWEKAYKRVKKFDGNPGEWRQWAFQFRVATKAVDALTVEALDDVEKVKTEVTTRMLGLDDKYLNKDIEQRSIEIYDILCMLCEGEALTIIQNVENTDGLVAWQKLF